MEEDGMHRLSILSLCMTLCSGMIKSCSVQDFPLQTASAQVFICATSLCGEFAFPPVYEAACTKFTDSQGTWQPVFAAPRAWNQSPQSRDRSSDENAYRLRGKDGGRWSSGAGER